ncbi:hypothetical protein [Aureliella helgolandensis]|nr:hypothetical protein [Aureliella helgolandensis]
MLFPLSMSVDGEVIQLASLSEQDYRAASFLDHRILESGLRRGVVAWTALRQAAEGLPIRCHFIFHTSHAGSTLLSRLIGERDAFFSVREPEILRRLVVPSQRDRRPLFLGLWSRTFHPNQTAVIKATSWVNEIASDLLHTSPGSRCLLTYVSLPVFLSALLDGAMKDIEISFTQRLHRLQQHGVGLGIEATQLTPGERVAMSWLAEMLTLCNVQQAFPARSRWVSFDRFLEEPDEYFNQAVQHLEPQVRSVGGCTPAIMQRYAKQMSVSYDANFRQTMLLQSQKKHAMEIQRGLDWFHRLSLDSVHNLPPDALRPVE